MGDHRLVDVYASRQYGVFSSFQLQKAGFDRSAVHRRVASGAWLKLAPGAFALASSPPIWERQMSAALLSRQRAISAGTSAAYLHGLRGFGARKPVIMVPWSGNGRSPIARVIRSTFFTTVATARSRGFTTTTIPETIMTLAGDLGVTRLEEILEDELLRGRVAIDDFEEIFDRLNGTRVAGLGRLRPLVAERLPDAFHVDATYLERLLQRLLSEPRIPTWSREHPFTLNGSAARVDVYIFDWTLVVEADGRQWHARQADFEADRRRDNELAAAGIQVVRFTYAMLTRNPEQCLATILDVGAHRRAERLG